MNILVCVNAYNSYGGHRVYSLVGEYLEAQLGDPPDRHGTGVKSLELTACLRSRTRKPRPTLESLFDKFHRELAALPKVVFRKKKGKLEIQYESAVMSAEEAAARELKVDHFNGALNEVAAILELARPRVRSSDDFAMDRFIRDVRSLSASPLVELKQLTEIETDIQSRKKARRAAMTAWDKVDVDWDEWHPEARRLLDDPFYWDCCEDHAPHGNDTGADLLGDYRDWLKRNRNKPPMGFLERLFQSWGITPVDWNMTDEDQVRASFEADWIPLATSDEAALALAFAELKLKGTCDPDVKGIALAAIRRELLPFRLEGWSDPKVRLSTLNMMRVKLESV